MPRQKGPEKKQFSVRLTVGAYDWLCQVAGALAPGAHIAADIEKSYRLHLARKARKNSKAKP